MNIVGTGLNGLVGSRIIELLGNYEFQSLSRQTGVDITNKDQVLQAITNSSSNLVLHLAAFTDVDGAEKEKDLGKESMAWKINVEGTRNIVEACEKSNKKIVYFSTDMVFSGTKKLPEKYSEDDETGPVGFYAQTKAEAEEVVKAASCPWLILRIAYPYRADFPKKDIVRLFKSLLEQGREINAVSDHYFTPTFIDDLAPVIDLIIKNDLQGILHATGSESVSPYDVALKIAKVFNLDEKLISKSTREEYFKDKAPRAYNLSLNNDKIGKLGVKLHSFSEGLEEVKKQIKI
jgi:dTDP-4-dehydrorhamnose reductase